MKKNYIAIFGVVLGLFLTTGRMCAMDPLFIEPLPFWNLEHAFDWDLNPSEVEHVKVTGQRFEGADGGRLEHADFRGVDLLNGDLSFSNLRGSRFNSSTYSELTVLFRMNFTGANLTGASFVLTSAMEANFTDANLTDVDFERANLGGANFTGANLTGVRFNKTRFTTYNRSTREVVGADFTGANLTEAVFESVNITRVRGLHDVINFTGAQFINVTMTAHQHALLVRRGVLVENARILGEPEEEDELRIVEPKRAVVTPVEAPAEVVEGEGVPGLPEEAGAESEVAPIVAPVDYLEIRAKFDPWAEKELRKRREESPEMRAARFEHKHGRLSDDDLEYVGQLILERDYLTKPGSDAWNYFQNQISNVIQGRERRGSVAGPVVTATHPAAGGVGRGRGRGRDPRYGAVIGHLDARGHGRGFGPEGASGAAK